MILAGVDIGTLTCRLLIARVSESGGLIELRSDRRIVRLGEDVDRLRTLRLDAMDRVISTLVEWRKIIETYPVDEQIAVATSAVRDAKNRDEFLGRIKREAGFEVELISGEEEARRTMLGMRSGLPDGVSSVLGLDIGGGRTGVILGRPGALSNFRLVEYWVILVDEWVVPADPHS